MPQLENAVRLVRVKAAWVLRQMVNSPSRALDDLLTYFRHNEDQPTGAFQLASYYAETGKLQQSLAWFEKAVKWDPG